MANIQSIIPKELQCRPESEWIQAECEQVLQTTDSSLSSSGPALRSSAYSDALLHIRGHWHAGKLLLT